MRRRSQRVRPLNLLRQYRSYLDGAYNRHGLGALRVVSFWWMPCLLPALFTDLDTARGQVVFWVCCGLGFAGVAASGWHLFGVSIRRSNAKAQRLEDEEWERFNG